MAKKEMNPAMRAARDRHLFQRNASEMCPPHLIAVMTPDARRLTC